MSFGQDEFKTFYSFLWKSFLNDNETLDTVRISVTVLHKLQGSTLRLLVFRFGQKHFMMPWNPDDSILIEYCKEAYPALLLQHGLSYFHFGEHWESNMVCQIWCLLDWLLDVEVGEGNHTYPKTSHNFPFKRYNWKIYDSGVKKLLPRRPGVLMFL